MGDRSLLHRWVGSICATVLIPVAAACAMAAQGGGKLAPDVPMPQDVVERMLAFAGVTRDDTVYDIGSGDGRIVVTAAKKYGAHGVGIEIDPARVSDAKRNAQRAGVGDLVTIRLQDAVEADVSPASVVTLYLTTAANAKLRPQLTRQLKPGARVVSLAFDMGNWKPTKVDRFDDVTGTPRVIYLWVAGPTPAQ
ncbi:MAG: methyltransferase domain-containing protein [Acidobacteriota bacterium]